MAQSSAPPDDKGPAAKVPYGALKGQPHLLPQQYGSLGANRPLGPGEFVGTPDGNWESEMTYSVPIGGKWSVVPGLWLMNGVPTHVNEDQAQQLAQQSGLNWPTFDNEQQANQFADQREAIWEKTPFGRSNAQQPLWSRPWPPKK
jgi:hypothetical protein